MARPLKKTYSPSHPYTVERHDQEDGSITYEVWDNRPDTYRRLCSINDQNDSIHCQDHDDQKDNKWKVNAKSDAEMIVHALNLMNGGLP